ncbi:MAG: FHA domain-containing protein [Nitrospinae bacterium]|nr:FHA domain-containing protein [Nitrospinota bacterium]
MAEDKKGGEDKSIEVDLGALLKEKEKLESLIQRKFTRDITVLFTDLTGSTRMSEALGDLEMRSLLKNHYDIIFPIVSANGGTLVKTMGDGTLSYFMDPSGAVRAAIGIQLGFAEFNQAKKHPELLIRCGLNTGRGIVEKNDVYGDVVNTAQRFESLAKPRQILISEETYQFVKDTPEFSIVFSQETNIKGKLGPQKVFRILWGGEEPQAAGHEYTNGKVTGDIPVEWEGHAPTTGTVKMEAAGQAKLTVEEAGKPPVVYDLLTSPLVIGRSAQADIRLNEGYVSRRHAQIVFVNGRYFMEDMGSHVGTLRSGARVAKSEMNDGDEFMIGTVKLVFSRHKPAPPPKAADPFADGERTMAFMAGQTLFLTVTEAGQETARYEVTQSPVIIGRTQEADVRLDNPLVSRKHAKIHVSSGKLVIEDLGSNNGTLVNGKKVDKVEASPGDEIIIGSFLLGLIDPMSTVKKEVGEASIVRKVFSFLSKKS